LVNILILRLCNYDKSPDHVESAGKFTLSAAAANLLTSFVQFYQGFRLNGAAEKWRSLVKNVFGAAIVSPLLNK
jgi:hypothetical protein